MKQDLAVGKSPTDGRATVNYSADEMFAKVYSRMRNPFSTCL